MMMMILPDISEEDLLLNRARRGEQGAIMQIYDHYFQPIYQYLRLRVDERQIAEDLASEVFLKMVEAFQGRNAPRHSLRGWLFKVARVEVARHYSKIKKHPTTSLNDWMPAPEEAQPEPQFVHARNIENARRAARMLAPEQQEVLALRFGQMLSLQESADIMGKSVSAVKSLQFRAVNTLRQILADTTTETANG